MAVRWVFGFRGDELWVEGVRRVGAVPPLGTVARDLAGLSGFWCELRDHDGSVRHRQALRDPRHPTDEIAGERRHVPARAPGGAFTAVTPDGGATVALVRRRAADPAPVDVLTAPVPGDPDAP